MHVLIAESDASLAGSWATQLRRQGAFVDIAPDEESACNLVGRTRYDLIIVDLVLGEGSALSVADLVGLRHPDVPVIFVTNTRFFADGSIFGLCPNVCAFVQTGTRPEDLAAMVEHFGTPRPRREPPAQMQHQRTH